MNKERKEGGFGNLIWRPINWLKMLSEELSWRFVLAVIIVYGINQGISIGLYRVSVQYYMKDVLKLQPSQAQFYSGIIQIPWIIKPLWGLMTDIVPIFRLRRRPYFIFAGFVGSIAMLVPAFSTSRESRTKVRCYSCFIQTALITGESTRESTFISRIFNLRSL